MTEQIELKIPYSDLTHLTITCKPCGAEISIDMEQDIHQKMYWKKNTAFACPVCKAVFDRELRFALEDFQHWYVRLKNYDQSVFFRVKKV